MGQIRPLCADAGLRCGTVYGNGRIEHAGLSDIGVGHVRAVADDLCVGRFFVLPARACKMECRAYLRDDALLYDGEI